MLRTLIHERVPEALRGRAFAAYNAARNAAELGALGAAGVLVGAIGAQPALLLAGLAPLAIGVAALLLVAPRTFPPPTGGPHMPISRDEQSAAATRAIAGCAIDDLPQIWDGFGKLVRAGLGITAFGAQIMDLPPRLHDGSPTTSPTPASRSSTSRCAARARWWRGTRACRSTPSISCAWTRASTAC